MAHANYFDIKTKNVNNKTLFNTIEGEISTGIRQWKIQWRDITTRRAVVETIEEILEELYDKKKITHYKVLCDSRNNTADELNTGKVRITIKYNQKDCLNTTEIEYKIN